MWPNPQEIVDFVTFNEKILNEKLHFCTVFGDVLMCTMMAGRNMSQ